MFNIKQFKLVKELSNKKAKLDWLKFSYSKNGKKDILNSIISDCKFLEEDAKIRAMVEDMLVKEFSSDIKNLKSYNFLVDSVVNKLKLKQLGNIDLPEEN